MFGFLLNNFRLRSRISSIHELYALQNLSRFSALRYLSSNADITNEHSSVVEYLVNSCGLSPKSALSASKRVNFETHEKPDSVLSLFRSYGFSETQISQLINKYPQVLTSNPEKTLLPKLEFFHSQGLSVSDVAHYLSNNPYILRSSPSKRIVPSFNFLRDLFKSDDRFFTVLKRCFYVLDLALEIQLTPKIKLLQDNGVPISNVLKLLEVNIPLMSFTKLEKFEEKVERAKKMGFNPSKTNFVGAVSILVSLSESTWARKVSAFKRWDWSDGEIVEAFRRHPFVMRSSEDKIVAVMNLFVNKLGWESSLIAKYPVLIKHSLEKRLVPRASVLQFLMSKGLVKEQFRSAAFFFDPEAAFLKKFINCYDEAPELLKLYEQKLAVSK